MKTKEMIQLVSEWTKCFRSTGNIPIGITKNNYVIDENSDNARILKYMIWIELNKLTSSMLIMESIVTVSDDLFIDIQWKNFNDMMIYQITYKSLIWMRKTKLLNK